VGLHGSAAGSGRAAAPHLTPPPRYAVRRPAYPHPVHPPSIRPTVLSALAVLTTWIGTSCLVTDRAPGQNADWYPMPSPFPIRDMRVALDEERSRLVLFASGTQTQTSSTWERIGGAWASTPPPREGFAMTYDPVRKRVVLFGGYNHIGPTWLQDTWEYDGENWHLRTPLVSPPAQVGCAMAFDYVTNRVLLCGGLGPTSSANSWLYDGTTWTSIPTLPAAGVALASDPVRRRVVAHTEPGWQGTSTFEWDGSTWTTAATGQASVYGHMAWIPAIGGIVLFGTPSSASAPQAPQLWLWNGGTWQSLGTTPHVQSSIGCVGGDPVRGTLVACGEFDDGTSPGYRMTAEWNGATWLHDTDYTFSWRPYWDGNRQSIVSHGISGWSEWDGSRWRNMPGAAAPPWIYSITFDATRQRAVAVLDTPPPVQTVEWDGTNWSTPVVGGLPCVATLSYHAGRGRVVACCTLGGVWEWNGAAWTAVGQSPAGTWTSIRDAQAVYDASTNRLVVVDSSWGFRVSTWNGTSWTYHLATSYPPQRNWYALQYDPRRQRIVLFGGLTGSTAMTNYDDTWEWDGTGWVPVAVSTRPHGRYDMDLVFDPARNQLLLINGRVLPGGMFFPEVWALGATNDRAAITTLGPGCGSTSHTPRLATSLPHPGAHAFTIDVHGAPPSTPCLYGLAFTPGSLPLGHGCTLFVPHQDHLDLTLTNTHGFASIAASIPIALLGYTFTAQAAVLDPNAAIGVGLTQGITIRTGW
jgi:hypothetical protein